MPLPSPGEPSPAFAALANDGKIIESDRLAGCFTTLCFFGSAGVPAIAEMVAEITRNTDLFDGENHRFIGVSIDPDDEAEEALPPPSVGVRMMWDFERRVSQLFGVASGAEGSDEDIAFQPLTVLIDPGLRVLAVHKIDNPAKHPSDLAQFLQALPKAGAPRPAHPQAPILLIPMVFELEFCRRLIAHFDEIGGQPSGILEDLGEHTVLTIDPERKSRRDLPIEDEALRTGAQARIRRRLVPEIRKAFQFDVTRMERAAIARYEASDFHGLHRDNAARGTAHRQFAITIPLNAEGHTGGFLRFPEYGPHVYPIPTGCALVHSCALLHELTPIESGIRYAFIPIVYGEAASEVREGNRSVLGPGVAPDRREVAVPLPEGPSE